MRSAARDPAGRGLAAEGRARTEVDFTLPANTGGPFRILFVLT
jgi:hypothetical protein